MEEYGYAIVTPYGYENGVHTKIVPQLIKAGYDSNLKTLISVYDFKEEEKEKLTSIISKRNIPLNLKKMTSVDTVTVILVRGVNANNILKDIVVKAQEEISKGNDDKTLLKVFVSNNEKEAIEDFCEYTSIDDFEKIESYLLESFSEKEIGSFNFKDLNSVKTK